MYQEIIYISRLTIITNSCYSMDWSENERRGPNFKDGRVAGQARRRPHAETQISKPCGFEFDAPPKFSFNKTLVPFIFR